MSEADEKISDSINLLIEILEDTSVPKNVRLICEKTKEILIKNNDIKIRINEAIQNLDLISDNTQVSTYTRMQIWNLVSLLESIV